MKRFIVVLILLIHNYVIAQTGSVGVGTNTPDNNAILDVYSTTKAVLLPRLGNEAIRNLPAKEGMVVYNLDNQTFMVARGGAGTSVTAYTAPTSSTPITPTSIAVQTYTAPATFVLRDFGVYLVSGTTATTFMVRVYSGTGTTGTLLGTSSLELPVATGGFNYFTLSGSTITLTGGQTYSFAITPNNSNSNSIGLYLNNPYPGGYTIFGGTTYLTYDLGFEVRSQAPGTWTALSTYSDTTYNTTLFNGPNTYATNVPIRLTKSGKNVTLTLSSDIVNLNVSSVNDIVMTALPAEYRPAANSFLPIRVQNAGTINIGLAYVQTNGNVFFKSNAAGSLWSGANSGLFSFSVTFPTP